MKKEAKAKKGSEAQEKKQIQTETLIAPRRAPCFLGHRYEVARVMNRRREAQIILPSPCSASNVKVFEYVFPFAPGEETAASATGDIAIDGLGAGLRLYYSINCLASRAIE
jgi:hypothetical protein